MPWKPITTIEELVARFENSVLDYKTTYDLAKDDVRFDIASDVAAFANAFGGSIVVGIREARGKAVEIPGVVNVPLLLKEVATAPEQHCVPVPSSPEEHELTVTPEIARHLLPEGAQLPNAPVTTVSLNVQPDARAPIGVLRFTKGPKGSKGMEHLYRFPQRLDDQTRSLDPTELPMWMNSHERRVALSLNGIPPDARVTVFAQDGSEIPPRETEVHVRSVDGSASIVVVEGIGPDSPIARIPLIYVEAVWQDAIDAAWRIAVSGRLFLDMRGKAVSFVPRIGGGRP
jgi:hypothetical protein